MSDYFAPEDDGVECRNCGGKHAHEFPECPVRVKEAEITRIRAVHRVSYAEQARIVKQCWSVSVAVETPQSSAVGILGHLLQW